MFKINFDLGIALYVGLIVFAISFFWIWDNSRNKITSDSLREKEFIWQCEICTYAYVDSKNPAFSKCPRCGSYNEHKKTKQVLNLTGGEKI
ncbi:MAG: hypothetical protein ABH836_02210 [Candidatus Omnitrophota bacterium]